MIARFVADLAGEVSPPRLAKYRPPGGADLDTAVNYLWNMTLAEALYPSLAAVEIGLRNAIHTALSTRYGTDHWFRHHDFVSNRNLGRELNRALATLGGRVAQPTAGQIVAELHFFYWTTILSGYYHRLLWNPNHAVLLRAVFPHLTGRQFQRSLIHLRYNTIRMFRNRVMHHEPILFGFTLPRKPTISLITMHRDILEAIGWTSPRLQASVALCDRFPAVHHTGRAMIEQSLRDHLGL